jgi:glucuronate isomerase
MRCVIGEDMKTFIHDDFLLNNDVARKLYHTYAKDLPIIDYHCHLDAESIYRNETIDNLSQAWLGEDHYKWRLMRAKGIDESFITGDEEDENKFMKWASVVPHLIGNPLYHWTHLELKRFFNIDRLLGPDTAKGIYDEASEQLRERTPRDLITMSRVEVICTTDDPTDTLLWHDRIRKDDTCETRVIPAFRPDQAMHVEGEDFLNWLKKLQDVVGYDIKTLDEFQKALYERMVYFHERGTRLSDHGLDRFIYAQATKHDVEKVFLKALQRKPLTDLERKQYVGHMLVFFGKAYRKLGWVQQYHIGALRNVSSRSLERFGPDSGFDAIDDQVFMGELKACLDELDRTHELPKTIVYTLNPRDFEPAITLLQAFQGEGIPGKMQFGSSWWFMDTIDGMTKQIKALANNGLLSEFIGMLTDSRSFLSYPRHEYFRRILCNIIGEEVEKGYFPEDYDVLGKIVQDVAYYNAKKYFDFS